MTVSESVIQWLKGFDEDRLSTVNTDMQTAEVKSYSCLLYTSQSSDEYLHRDI